MIQQGRVRRSSYEFEAVPAVPTTCYQDTVGGCPSNIDQDTLSLLLAASAQNGVVSAGLAAGFANKSQLQYLGSAPDASVDIMPVATGADGFDPSLVELEEPGPLPCLPRSRHLGSGGPYNSSAAAVLHQQSTTGRQGRPRRHSVTLGMLSEQHQQQQAAAYAAALAAAQPNGLPPIGPPSIMEAGPAGLGGLLEQVPQTQDPLTSRTSPVKPQLQALGTVQAMAAAGSLGLGTSALMPGLAASHPEHLQQQYAVNGTMPIQDTAELGPPFNLNAPRLPNAGGYRRHSWAPTSLNGTAYAQMLLMQQQQLAAAAAMADPRVLLGINGLSGGPSGGLDSLSVSNLGMAKPKGLGAAGRTQPSTFTNNSRFHAQNSSGPPSGGFAGLPATAAAVAAQLASLQTTGALAGLDPVSEQQFTRLLQLQQQVGLAVTGQPVLDPYMEAVLETGQNMGQPPASVRPTLAPVTGLGISPTQAGLLPTAAAAAAAAAATQHLSQLGLGLEGLNPAAAAAAANMYAPLQINGVTVDSQLLVAPFADNWDRMCAQGQAGITCQQLAALAAAGVNAGQLGFSGSVSSHAGSNTSTAMAHMQLGKQGSKALPLRTGSVGSGSSSSSGTGSSQLAAGTLTAHAPLTAQSSSKAGAAGSAASGSSNVAATTSDTLATASLVAAVPPIANVCSDVPWDLNRAAEEDALVLAAQEGRVQQLISALERSQTLSKMRTAAQDAPAGNKSKASCSLPVLFGYQLPDTGADAWGGSSSSAAVESAPGSGCMSQDPSNKLFVGNIGWWVTEEDLLQWFSRFGTVVHVKIMYNSRKMHKPKDKWRSREYGFIDYATPDEAAKAILWMDGVELPDLMKDTCGIIVQYAKPTGGNGGGSSGAEGSNGHI